MITQKYTAKATQIVESKPSVVRAYQKKTNAAAPSGAYTPFNELYEAIPSPAPAHRIITDQSITGGDETAGPEFAPAVFDAPSPSAAADTTRYCPTWAAQRCDGLQMKTLTTGVNGSMVAGISRPERVGVNQSKAPENKDVPQLPAEAYVVGIWAKNGQPLYSEHHRVHSAVVSDVRVTEQKTDNNQPTGNLILSLKEPRRIVHKLLEPQHGE